MIRAFRNIGQLYGLAVGLRRYGALRSLDYIELVPSWGATILRTLTFYIPRRRKLPENDGERLALALSHMGPTYIKMGQMLATRPDIVGRTLAPGLATLQDKLAPFAFTEARKTIERDLGGKITDHYSDFDEIPIAAASIAQVHCATTIKGQKVAVKIVRPNVARLFQRDLRLFKWIARLGERFSSQGRRLKLSAIVDTVQETVMQELTLTLEASASDSLSVNMEGEQGYRIPAVDWDLTSTNVLTTEWVDGIRLFEKDKLIEAGHDLNKLGETIVHVFLTQALRDGYFHADLHQGNLIVESDGTIVAIDFGMMGRLSKHDRRYMAEILYGFGKRDYIRVAEIHFEAGWVPRGQSLEEFADALRTIADPIMDLPVEEISAGKLLAQLFATTERFSMQTQPQLLLLQRTMVMAEGMALHLDARINMWKTSEPVIEAWVLSNLSPEVRLADFLRDIPRAVERFPSQMDRLMERLDADEALLRELKSSKRPVNEIGILWFVIGVLSAALASNFIN